MAIPFYVLQSIICYLSYKQQEVVSASCTHPDIWRKFVIAFFPVVFFDV
jgi:hypothetical protein